MLQCVAVVYSVLQCVAVYCSVLQWPRHITFRRTQDTRDWLVKRECMQWVTNYIHVYSMRHELHTCVLKTQEIDSSKESVFNESRAISMCIQWVTNYTHAFSRHKRLTRHDRVYICKRARDSDTIILGVLKTHEIDFPLESWGICVCVCVCVCVCLCLAYAYLRRHTHPHTHSPPYNLHWLRHITSRRTQDTRDRLWRWSYHC